jgi:hypothetical protein
VPNDIDNLPPHIKQQAMQAARDSGVAQQAAATQQSPTQGEAIDQSQRSFPERNREAQQEQASYDQTKSQTPEPEQNR